MKKVMVVFGTRPEAIKMCPLVLELKKREGIDVKVCVIGQHRQLLDQVLTTFCVKPKYYLAVIKEKQILFDITKSILIRIKEVLKKKSQICFWCMEIYLRSLLLSLHVLHEDLRWIR